MKFWYSRHAMIADDIIFVVLRNSENVGKTFLWWHLWTDPLRPKSEKIQSISTGDERSSPRRHWLSVNEARGPGFDQAPGDGFRKGGLVWAEGACGNVHCPTSQGFNQMQLVATGLRVFPWRLHDFLIGLAASYLLDDRIFCVVKVFFMTMCFQKKKLSLLAMFCLCLYQQ